MDAKYYPQIFKRKSFHLFRNTGNVSLTETELDGIYEAWKGFEPLCPEIRTAIRIVPAAKINFKRDAEYCVLIYSEAKDNYLMNAGYMGQQLDLYLVSQNIGSLWYGIGRPDMPEYDGLTYAIMFAVRKVPDDTMFRKALDKTKRKDLSRTWEGEIIPAADVARHSPSACNSQPWFVKNTGEKLEVYRTRPAKVGIMSVKNAVYFNRIDIGIYLCILEICLAHDGVRLERQIFVDRPEPLLDLSKVAEYTLVSRPSMSV